MPVMINRRLPECGRIRIGRKGDRGQPQRLNTFRLTSKDKPSLDAAAILYGGKVVPWPGHEGEWELVTETAEIPILISPEPPSLWYELWSAGGCKRRCDGTLCSVPQADGIGQVPCMCDPENRECGLKTRVSFVLPDLPALGIWRLDTGSWYAATELPGMIDMLQAAKQRNQFPEAVLALESRKVVRQKNGKPETRIFPVATIRIRQTVRELLSGVPASHVAAIQSTPATRAIESAPVAAHEVVEEVSFLQMESDAPKLCPVCHAPEGKPHSKLCNHQSAAA